MKEPGFVNFLNRLRALWIYSRASESACSGSRSRGSRSSLFVLVNGIGMVALGAIGFYEPAQVWLAETFNLTTVSSTVELATGIASLMIYARYRALARARLARLARLAR